MRGPVEIPFPLSSNPGLKPQESGGRLINTYLDAMPASAKAKRIYRRAPGLATWGTTARTGFRGSIEIGGVYYAAFSGQLEKWSSSSGGASTNVGALNGTAKGFFARNNASTPDKVFVDPSGNIATFTPTAVTNSYPDADLPAVNACCDIDGYMVFTTGNGRAYATDLNSTAVNALSFGASEVKPDGLVRPIPWSGMLLLFGQFSCEFWTNQSLSPFPFARSASTPRGLAGPYCVTGHEDGFGRALAIVGDDNRVSILNGYQFDPISPPDLDAKIEAVTDKTTIHMCSYMSRGHAFIQVTGPTFSWFCDISLANRPWFERQSYGLTYSRIIGARNVNVFGKWLTGDSASGNIREITASSQHETSDPFRMRLESGPVLNFPSGERVARADFDFVTGVGIASGTDPIQTNPKVEVSWSDDGGQTWSAALERELGRQSVTGGLVSLVGCTGRSTWNGRRWRLDVSDPVHASFMGGVQSASPRKAGN